MSEPPAEISGYRIHAWDSEPVWETFPRPVPGALEVLVQVDATSIGLTVLNMIRGDLADDRASLPLVPGHEIVGRVVELGAGADPALLGRRVIDYIYLYCSTCPECVAGTEDRCRRLAGYIGVQRDGGYAPFVALPARNVVVVPDDLDPLAATVIPDAVSTSVHVCRSRAEVTPHDRVAIIGAGGGVGIHTLQVARLHGALVAGLDVEDDKLAAIEELGASPVRSDDFERLDPGLWPEGTPTVVVDFVGSRESLGWALEAVGSGGRVVLVTTFRGVTTELDPRRMVMTEATVRGSRYATRHEVGLAVELVASGRVRPIIGTTVEPADVLEVHRQLRGRRLVGRGAIRWH
jgi:propanol-preferring alcohol dehydrogenase